MGRLRFLETVECNVIIGFAAVFQGDANSFCRVNDAAAADADDTIRFELTRLNCCRIDYIQIRILSDFIKNTYANSTRASLTFWASPAFTTPGSVMIMARLQPRLTTSL